jgi:hypothetical protein
LVLVTSRKLFEFCERERKKKEGRREAEGQKARRNGRK